MPTRRRSARLILLASIAMNIAACATIDPGAETTPAEPAIGSSLTVRGVAENWKVGAYLNPPGIGIDLPARHWPDHAVGRTVQVTGVVAERHDLPVFIQEPDELPIAGIPVPPGTDQHQASRRLVLEKVRWTVVDAGE